MFLIHIVFHLNFLGSLHNRDNCLCKTWERCSFLYKKKFSQKNESCTGGNDIKVLSMKKKHFGQKNKYYVMFIILFRKQQRAT